MERAVARSDEVTRALSTHMSSDCASVVAEYCAAAPWCGELKTRRNRTTYFRRHDMYDRIATIAAGQMWIGVCGCIWTYAAGGALVPYHVCDGHLCRERGQCGCEPLGPHRKHDDWHRDCPTQKVPEWAFDLVVPY